MRLVLANEMRTMMYVASGQSRQKHLVSSARLQHFSSEAVISVRKPVLVWRHHAELSHGGHLSRDIADYV